MKNQTKHLVLHFQLLPEEQERFIAQAGQNGPRLQNVLQEAVTAMREHLPDALDGYLMWVVTPDDIQLTVTTVPWMGVAPAAAATAD